MQTGQCFQDYLLQDGILSAFATGRLITLDLKFMPGTIQFLEQQDFIQTMSATSNFSMSMHSLMLIILKQLKLWSLQSHSQEAFVN